jgi:hypothetical protein
MRPTTHAPARTTRRLALLSLLVLPAALPAQVANPLPQAVGMGDNYTALARGFAAVHWNPAGLGLPDNPRSSFSVLPVSAHLGLGPITAGDFADHNGRLIPHEARVRWLDRIRADGGETGDFGADLTFLTFSAGRLAVAASSTVRARAHVAPDVAEVFLFGNAGLTGDPRDYTLEGSAFDAAGTSTVAASLALPVPLELGPLPDQHFALGITVKYTLGHFLLMGREQGSSLRTDPLEVDFRFPMIYTGFEDGEDGTGASARVNNGSGFGLDLGAAWQGGIFQAGLVIRNLVNTFEWSRDGLRYRAGKAVWTADTTWTRFEDRPIQEAPADLLARMDETFSYGPVLALAGAARVLPYLTLSGEARHALEDNLAPTARTHLGLGGELAILPVLPVRAGLSLVTGGYQLSGGLGLVLGSAQITGGAAYRKGDAGNATIAAFGLTFGVR